MIVFAIFFIDFAKKERLRLIQRWKKLLQKRLIFYTMMSYKILK